MFHQLYCLENLEQHYTKSDRPSFYKIDDDPDEEFKWVSFEEEENRGESESKEADSSMEGAASISSSQTHL